MTDEERLATEVMQWELVRPEDIGMHRSNHSHYYYNDPDSAKNERVMNSSNWNPKKNIDQAFMLVDKMRENGWEVYITLLPENLTIVTICRQDPDPADFEAVSHVETDAGDLAEFICNAILKTLENDDEA